MLLFSTESVCYNRDISMAIKDNRQEEYSLALAAKKGEAEAFGRLYESYIKKIYDFIYYKTLNKETAEDLTSAVFVKAWDKMPSFRGESFAAWLYAIARNAVIDHYRQEKATTDIEDCWDIADNQDFISRIDNNLRLSSIKEALSSLKPAAREVLIMRFWLDLSFREIAERSGRSEAAAKMMLARALREIRGQVSLALLLLWPLVNGLDK